MLHSIMIKAALIAMGAIVAAACGANEGVLRSGKPDPNAVNAASQGSTVERVVADMRTAGFTTIFVLRRRDGGKMDSADRSVIRVQTSDANRRIGSDDEKAFIIGSNHPMTAEKMAVLNDKFALEDLSPPPDANVTANANK